MKRLVKPLLFYLAAFLLLFVTQSISNVVSQLAILSIRGIYPWYGLIRAVLYVAAAILCFQGMVKWFELSWQECRILPIRLKSKLWVPASLIVCLLLLVIYIFVSEWLLMLDLPRSTALTLWVQGIAYFTIGSPIVEGILLAMLLKIGEESFGRVGAVIYAAIGFTLFYLPNMSSLSGAALLMFGAATGLNLLAQVLIILESGSVWNSVFFHGMWNLFLASGIVYIGPLGNQNAIFVIPMDQKSILLTGGAASCQSSILAMIMLGILILLAGDSLYRKTRDQQEAADGNLESKGSIHFRNLAQESMLAQIVAEYNKADSTINHDRTHKGRGKPLVVVSEEWISLYDGSFGAGGDLQEGLALCGMLSAQAMGIVNVNDELADIMLFKGDRIVLEEHIDAGGWLVKGDLQAFVKAIDMPYTLEDIEELFDVADNKAFLEKFHRLTNCPFFIYMSACLRLQAEGYLALMEETPEINIYRKLKPFEWDEHCRYPAVK